MLWLCLKGTSTATTNWCYIVGLKVWISILKLTSGKKVLVYQKVRYEYHLLSLLNFAGAASLNFYDVKWLPLLLHTKESCFKTKFNTARRHFESYLAAWPLVRHVKMYKETSSRVTWALKNEPKCCCFVPRVRRFLITYWEILKLKPLSAAEMYHESHLRSGFLRKT